MHLDAFVAQHLQERRGNIGVLPRGELWSRFKDGDAAAEAPIGLREFQADIAAAEYNEVVGQAVKLEQLDIGEG